MQNRLASGEHRKAPTIGWIDFCRDRRPRRSVNPGHGERTKIAPTTKTHGDGSVVFTKCFGNGIMFKSDIMPMQARKQSASGIYHIMLRGINQQVIFKCDEDKEKFLQTLNHYKAISEYKIFTYCLMSNHIHLLIKVEKENLDLIKRDKYLKLCREKGI